MARIRVFTAFTALATAAILSGCGDNADEAAAAAAPAADDVQVAEAVPAPAPDAPTAPAADLPLTRDFSTDTATIQVLFPIEAAQDRALYDLLLEEAQPQIEESQQLSAEDKAYREQDDIPFHMHALEIAWTAPFQNGRVTSLLATTFVNQGGAHPNTYFDTRLWDRQEQALIAETDLFTDAAWAALSPLAEQAVLAEKRARLGDGLSDEDYWRSDVILATAPAAENFGIFTLVPSTEPGLAGGIALHYSPYEVGPYAEGDYHVVIPQAAFVDYVAPEYAGLFGGAPAAGAD